MRQSEKSVLVVIRSSPNSKKFHFYVQETIQSLIASEARLKAVFFMDEAACLCSRNLARGCVRSLIQEGYKDLAKKTGVSLLCCGRAFADLGMANSDIAPCFQLSGNFELATLFTTSYLTLEF